jgi:hypothetical protein
MRCCICGKEFEGYGNNPYPLCYKEDYESKCCNECNDAYVIQARLIQMKLKDGDIKEGDLVVIFHSKNSNSPINTLVNNGKFLAGYAEESDVQGNWTGSWGNFILDKEDSYKIGDK